MTGPGTCRFRSTHGASILVEWSDSGTRRGGCGGADKDETRSTGCSSSTKEHVCKTWNANIGELVQDAAYRWVVTLAFLTRKNLVEKSTAWRVIPPGKPTIRQPPRRFRYTNHTDWFRTKQGMSEVSAVGARLRFMSITTGTNPMELTFVEWKIIENHAFFVLTENIALSRTDPVLVQGRC